MMTDRDRNAGTPASHAAERPGHHPHGGLEAWFRFRLAPLAGARAGLRALLPALFAFLLLAGWTPGAGAVTLTANPSFVCQGQTVDVVFSGFSAGQSDQFYRGSTAGTATAGTNFRILNSDGTEMRNISKVAAEFHAK